jgi:hypothetical protein
MFAVAPQAHAFDGCKVLLCLAGQWRLYGECRPDVREALRCMARGKCWPTCAEAPGLSLSWASGAVCPPQYVVQDYETGASYCTKNAVMTLAQDGIASWLRIWMNTSADASPVIEYSPEAKAAMPLEFIDPTFDNDLAVWLATQPPPDTSGQGGG